MSPPSTPDWDALLAHTGWIRELARRLAADASSADDLVQRTWVAALERPPEAGTPIRRWLAVVLRNLARQDRRRDGRRASREFAAARPEAITSAHEVAETIALQQAVLTGVSALEEPYRSAIVQRYYEGLSPQAISERTGAPVKTIKTRLARGLDQLRARLDREYGGDRRAWLSACAAVFPRPSWIQLTLGALLVDAKAKAAIVALVGIGALATWRYVARVAEPSAHSSVPELGGTTQLPAARHASESDASDPERQTDSTPPEGMAAPDAKGSELEATELAEIRGRFLFSERTPASGVALQLIGLLGDLVAARTRDVPSQELDLRTTTDTDGRFSLRFAPPTGFHWSLRGKLAGYAQMGWLWLEVPPGKVIDLGDTLLTRAGTIVGRLIDTEKRPLTGPWTVHAESSLAPDGRNGDRTRLRVEANPDSGEFEFIDVPPGAVELKAYSEVANWIEGPIVQVRSGETTETEIIYGGPDYKRRILVWPSCSPFHAIDDPAPGTILLHTPQGRTLTAEPAPGTFGAWSFEDLDPGTYTVEITDERFEPWSQSGIAPGESIQAPLKGSSSLILTVTDGRTGEHVVEYGLEIELLHTHSLPNRFEIRTATAPEPAGSIYDGLVPRDMKVSVLAAGYAPTEIRVDDLAPLERRPIQAVLSRGGTIEGMVSRSTKGDPASGISVRLSPHFDESEPAPTSFSRLAADRERGLTTTDADGRYVFERVSPGRYDLWVSAGPLIHVERVDLVVSGEVVEWTREGAVPPIVRLQRATPLPGRK